jgi:hypothetical protein
MPTVTATAAVIMDMGMATAGNYVAKLNYENKAPAQAGALFCSACVRVPLNCAHAIARIIRDDSDCRDETD